MLSVCGGRGAGDMQRRETAAGAGPEMVMFAARRQKQVD